MIAHLRGTVHKLHFGSLIMDVQGVGYLLQVPIDVWEQTSEEGESTLYVYTYVREDRLDLFGFTDWSSRILFAQLMKVSGIGPSLGLELCNVPKNLLSQAIHEQDPGLLTNIKGIGRKRAEKLLVDLKSLMELLPEIFSSHTQQSYDPDAMAALSALGYDNSTILQVLKDLPADLATTEERVAAALRSL